MSRSSAPLALEYVLLGILDQNPMHGYDLFRRLNSINGIRLIWNLKQSLLYALLDKLESDGLLSGQVIAGESRPSRREYSLTPAGREAFHAWMHSPVEHGRQMRQDFLARLYFAIQAGNETALGLIDQQKQLCLRWQEEIQSSCRESTGSNFDRFVLSFRLSQVQSMLDWLENCTRELIRPQ